MIESLSGVDQDTPIYDDFAQIGVRSEQDIIDLYTSSFYFGCEADDPMTAWAFDPRMNARVKAVFSSDISHWDVPVMVDVVPEAYELLEKGLLSEADFRAFVFSNAVHLHGDGNPAFFEGTTLESAATLELRQSQASAVSRVA